jgi:hypothetical protein
MCSQQGNKSMTMCTTYIMLCARHSCHEPCVCNHATPSAVHKLCAHVQCYVLRVLCALPTMMSHTMLTMSNIPCVQRCNTTCILLCHAATCPYVQPCNTTCHILMSYTHQHHTCQCTPNSWLALVCAVPPSYVQLCTTC